MEYEKKNYDPKFYFIIGINAMKDLDSSQF